MNNRLNDESQRSSSLEWDYHRLRSGERGSLPIPIRKPTMPTPCLVLPTIDGYTISHSLLIDNMPTDSYGFLLDGRPLGDSLHTLKDFELRYTPKMERQAQRWANIVPVAKGDLAVLPPPSKKIKSALRKGLPRDLRDKAWFFYSGAQASQDAEPKRYVELVNLAKKHPNYPLEMQIDSDVSHTFSNNRRFRSLKITNPFIDILNAEDCLAQASLRRILLAIAHAFPHVSYTNGLNSIGAALLLVTENEQQSFWIMYRILSALLPESYYADMNLGCNVDQDVLGALIAWKLPSVFRKLQTLEISLHLVTASWFTHLFVDQLPFESLLRVWDSFLFEGSKVLFRIALALFKINQEALLQITSPLELASFVRKMPKNQIDTIELMETAFHGIGWLGHSWLAQERRQALPYWKARHSVRRFSRVSPSYCQASPSPNSEQPRHLALMDEPAPQFTMAEEIPMPIPSSSTGSSSRSSFRTSSDTM